jgi:hypothetical protein
VTTSLLVRPHNPQRLPPSRAASQGPGGRWPPRPYHPPAAGRPAAHLCLSRPGAAPGTILWTGGSAPSAAHARRVGRRRKAGPCDGVSLGEFCQRTYHLACLFVRLLCRDNSYIARLCACHRFLKTNENPAQSGAFFSGNRLNGGRRRKRERPSPPRRPPSAGPPGSRWEALRTFAPSLGYPNRRSWGRSSPSRGPVAGVGRTRQDAGPHRTMLFPCCPLHR